MGVSNSLTLQHNMVIFNGHAQVLFSRITQTNWRIKHNLLSKFMIFVLGCGIHSSIWPRMVALYKLQVARAYLVHVLMFCHWTTPEPLCYSRIQQASAFKTLNTTKWQLHFLSVPTHSRGIAQETDPNSLLHKHWPFWFRAFVPTFWYSQRC